MPSIRVRRGWMNFGCKLVLAGMSLLSMTPVMADVVPVALWRLDEGTGTSTADASGNNNTGTLTGSPTWTTGHIGNALNFNNLNSYVNVSPASSINNLYSGGITVMARIKPASAGESNGGRIMVKGSTGTAGFGFKMVSGNKVQFVGGFSTTSLTRTTAATVTLNAWQHVAATWSGSSSGADAHMYMNGALSDGTSVNGVGTTGDDSTSPIIIGNQADLTRGFDGSIDDVRVYSRVLTASEIQTIANDNADPSAPGTATATAASSTQINLTWTAAADDIAVAGYRLERCQGSGCANFVQIATPTTTSYTDTGLNAATSYSYRVRALDTAYNFSSYSSTATTSTQATPTGPVATWSFSEGTGTSTADASGNGNTGTLTGSPAWTTGQSGNALSFNNLNSYVNVSPANSINNLYSGGVTLMAWIKPASAGEGSGGRIMVKGSTGTAGVGMKMVSGNKVQFIGGFSTTTLNRSSASAVTLNTWQHVAATWDGTSSGGNAHIYLNGALSDGTSVNGVGTPGDDSASPITIGNQPDLTRGFDGIIDDVRVYNRVLTASEIQTIANDYAVPSAPTDVTATRVSNTEILLSWTAATDNVGVTSYLIERCQGIGCTNFTQVAVVNATSYSDTGLSAGGTYSYRVRAVDAANNSGSYSSVASGSTQNPNPITYTYGYDALGRLSSATGSDGSSIFYQYDANGNMTTIVRQ